MIRRTPRLCSGQEGVSERFGVPLGFTRGKKAVDTPRLRSGQEGLVALGDCGDKFSGAEKEGLDGDTVSRTLSYIYRIRYCLSSEKLNDMD